MTGRPGWPLVVGLRLHRGRCRAAYYRTYPGLRVPNPLMLRPHRHDTPFTDIARDVLALSKMSWNTTQFDGALPIPIRAARQVGRGAQAAIRRHDRQPCRHTESTPHMSAASALMDKRSEIWNSAATVSGSADRRPWNVPPPRLQSHAPVPRSARRLERTAIRSKSTVFCGTRSVLCETRSISAARGRLVFSIGSTAVSSSNVIA